jgi:hypothetical protein
MAGAEALPFRHIGVVMHHAWRITRRYHPCSELQLTATGQLWLAAMISGAYLRPRHR